MRYAIIENGVVANIVEADGPLPGLEMVEAGSAHIGHLFDGVESTAPPPPPPPVPESVSPRQIRQALTRAGLRTAVEAAVAGGDQDLKDWWEFATDFQRAHPMVIALAGALDVSEQEVDDLFVLAGSL